jgi:hypothetical protein
MIVLRFKEEEDDCPQSSWHLLSICRQHKFSSATWTPIPKESRIIAMIMWVRVSNLTILYSFGSNARSEKVPWDMSKRRIVWRMWSDPLGFVRWRLACIHLPLAAMRRRPGAMHANPGFGVRELTKVWITVHVCDLLSDVFRTSLILSASANPIYPLTTGCVLIWMVRRFWAVSPLLFFSKVQISSTT